MESRKQKNIKDLYKCFNQIVIIAQLFGLLPIAGLKHNKAKKIVFKWCSFNAIYCHLVIVATFIVVLMSIYDLLLCKLLLQKISTYAHATFYFNLNLVHWF